MKPGTGYGCTASELGELFYTELGSEAGGTIQLTHDSAADLFTNLQPYLYWSGTTDTANTNGNGQQTFSFGSGFQGGNFDANDLYVIPVLDGRIDAVAEPPGWTAGFAALGLLWTGWMVRTRRRRNRRRAG